jgi:hypothetical protein
MSDFLYRGRNTIGARDRTYAPCHDRNACNPERPLISQGDLQIVPQQAIQMIVIRIVAGQLGKFLRGSFPRHVA